MGDHVPEAIARRFFLGGFHQLRVLAQGAPDFSSPSGERFLLHLGTWQEISTQAVQECGANAMASPEIQKEEISHGLLAIGKPFNYFPILMVAPYGIHRYAKRLLSLQVSREISEHVRRCCYSNQFPSR